MACVAGVKKGRGRGNFCGREQAKKMEKTIAYLQAFLSFLRRAPHTLSRAQIPPSPSPFNTDHAGYCLCNIVMYFR